jgi:hypothetical protein
MILGSSYLSDLSVVEKGYPVAEVVGFGHIVRRQKDSCSVLVQVAQNRHECLLPSQGRARTSVRRGIAARG